MKNILISGYYGSRNGGDEAILEAMLESLRELDGDLHFTVISLNPEYTKTRNNVDAVKFTDFFSIVREIRKADLLIFGGGSLLQNVTSQRSLCYYLGIIFLAELFGCKIMLYAQGIGPVRGKSAELLMKFFVNRVDLITVRDKGSLDELKRLDITRPKIFRTADPVLAINPVSPEIGKSLLPTHYSLQHKIGVSVRSWINWNTCRNEFAVALDKLVEELNAEIIFIPMQYPEDVKAAQSIVDIMKNPAVVIDKELSTAQTLSLAGCVDILIGVRLHALIFAGVMNVPTVGISYDPKIDRFLESINEKPVASLHDITAQKIFDATVEKLKAGKNLNPETQKLKSELRELALKNARLAVNLLNN